MRETRLPKSAFTVVLLASLAAPAKGDPQGGEPEPSQSGLPRAMLTIEIAGPAAIRDAFLATNVGNLIGGDESEGVWTGVFRNFAHIWYRSEGAHDNNTFEPFRKLLAGYRGTMRLRVFRSERRFLGAIEFLPDGKSDLGSMARGLARMLRNATAGKSKSIEIGGARFETLATMFEPVTLPVLHRDRVVVFFGRKIEEDVTVIDRLLARERVKPTTRLAGGPLRLRLDMPQVIEEAKQSDYWKFVDSAVHASKMRALELRISPGGPHVHVDVTLQVEEEFGGLLGALIHPSRTKPDLQHLPGNATRWSSFALSYETLWQILADAGFSDGFDDFFGVDIKGDIIDNLKPGLKFFGRNGSDFCLEFLTRDDGPVVEQAFITLMNDSKESEDESESYRGVTIRSHGIRSGDPLHSAVHDGRLILAFGEKGEDYLRKSLDSVLDAQDRDKGEDKKPQDPNLGMPAPIFRTRAAMPPGCNGAGVVAAEDIPDSLLGWLLIELPSIANQTLPAFLGTGKLLDRLRDVTRLFRKYKLDNVVWYTGREKNRVHIRFVW